MAPDRLPPELAVPAGATRVEARGDGAEFEVQYRLAVPYPAEAFLGEVQSSLAGRGWKPMERDFMNPDVPTSHLRGWTALVDPGAGPPQGVHRWQSDWSNARGDVVHYNLEYAAPANTIDRPPPADAELKVTAFLRPAERARAMGAAAQRARKR